MPSISLVPAAMLPQATASKRSGRRRDARAAAVRPAGGVGGMSTLPTTLDRP
jgi:hypothetical protein